VGAIGKDDSMNLTQIQSKAKRAPKQWRSLDELHGKAKFNQWVDAEFGTGFTEGLDEGSRRQILKLMAASFGLAGLVACRRPEEHILPVAKGVEDVIPGKPIFYNTAYVTRGVATGVQVEVHDGRPTKIEGNPLHPSSKGGATAQAQASVLGVYDPDRIKGYWQEGKSSDKAAFVKAAGLALDPAKLGKGAGLRFLAERTSSPTLLALKAEALQKYPEAKWAEFDSVDAGNAIAGAEAAFGQRLQPHYHFGKADVVLALDFDFLNGDSPNIQPVKDFSARRKVNKPGDEMNRLYVAESQFSVTGTMADHRLRIKASEVGQLASDLAVELGATSALKVLKAGDATQKWIAAVARDLKAHAGKSIVAAGPRQSPAVHALAYLINQQLGNLGATVTFTAPVFQPAQSLKDLAQEMANGQVGVLVMLGGNPAYAAPADLKFTAGLAKVPVSIYLGLDEDETAHAAKWVVPAAHYLEAWGDARAIDGTLSVQQPMIMPLYDGMSAIELVAMVIGHPMKKGYDLVRSTWKDTGTWRKALHDGFVAGTAFAEVKPGAAAKALPAVLAPLSLEVVFVPSASVDDGRYNNNGWLQEAPDPMSKVVWDNVALVPLKWAKEKGLKDGQIVKITTSGGSLEAAAMAGPGQADGSVTIALGYGRSKVGRVGMGTGFNANLLRTSEGFSYASATIELTNRMHELVTTQEQHRMEEPKLISFYDQLDRPVVRETTAQTYKEHPDVIAHMVHLPEMFDLQGTHDYSKGNQWGMAIDLNACTGCNACLVACVAENNIPVVGKDQVKRGREMHWIRLDRYYTGHEEDPQAVMQPIGCQHCEAAPCENVCPVAATVHSPEGLNEMAYNRCVGTRYCANNCPYKVRRFNYLDWHKKLDAMKPEEKAASEMVFNPDVSVRMRGVIEKCTYCTQRIAEKKILAKQEGRRKIKDLEILTACQQTCPADAIIFGNINDPESAVSKARKQERNYKLLEDINTKPRTTFLARLRNPNPELAPAGGKHDAHKEVKHG
jgi:MoCo/4Fe-4S cofactor protein with predicted Tat translocation signal